MPEERHAPRGYLSGFGGVHQSEALAGALPRHQNSPRRAPYGLYPEQVNGTSFTVPRGHNLRTWLYRIRPTVNQSRAELIDAGDLSLSYLREPVAANVEGWRPMPLPADDESVDFVDGLHTVGGAGDPSDRRGLAVHVFAANASMRERAFSSSDGDLLILPDTGLLHIRTELGWLEVAPGQLALIPTGLRFAVHLPGGPARGLVCEPYGRHFGLPERGVIGANALADARHFQAPVADYEDRAVDEGFRVTTKLAGRLWDATASHSTFDVVAWHGNLVPYRFDLRDFSPMGAVRMDHADPSIYSVLSAPLDHPGENTADLVFFPDRWDVTENTVRPPFYHRNAATELNAIITGPTSDAVFSRGGCYLTPSLTPHGVRPGAMRHAYEASDDDADRHERLGSNATWIQLESTFPLRLSPWATDASHRDPDFSDFARGVPARFDPDWREG